MADDTWYHRAQELEAENTRLRAELAAERARLDFIETYVKARAEEHEFLAGMAGGALSGKKQRVRAHEASTILGRIREVRK